MQEFKILSLFFIPSGSSQALKISFNNETSESNHLITGTRAESYMIIDNTHKLMSAQWMFEDIFKAHINDIQMGS